MPSPIQRWRDDHHVGGVLGVDVADALKHLVALDDNGVDIDGDAFHDAAGHRVLGIEIVLLVGAQHRADLVQTCIVAQLLIKAVAIRQRACCDMEHAVLGMIVGRDHTYALDGICSHFHVFGVEQQHVVGNGGDGAEGAREVVENEESLHHGVALVGLDEIEQRVLVECPVDRSHDGERLSAVEQVGITHRGLLVHSENLGLLQHLAEVAEFGLRLQFFP